MSLARRRKSARLCSADRALHRLGAAGRDAWRTQLIEATHRLHPDAWFKSFAGSVASFVAGKHLVVARCGESFDTPESERAPDDWDQKALFGDAA